MPAASVLFPFKNAAAWVEEAAESISTQTFGDFEVLAVDDRSEDSTRERVEAWRSRDRRVRVLETLSLPKGGLVSALELARREARADVLVRMDADDIAPPGRFEAQMRLLRTTSEVVACGVPIRRFPREQLSDGGRAYETWLNSLQTPEQISRDLFVECPIAHPTLAVRAQALDGVGGYREGPFPEDYDLVLRLALAGGRLAKAACPPQLWRDHAGQLQRTDPRYSIQAFRSLKVEHLTAGPLRDHTSVVIIGSGPTGKAFSKLLRQRGKRIRAFVDLDPRKIGQTIHGAPVLDPGGLGEPAGRVALSAVSGVQARELIRGTLEGLGWTELSDFWAVA